MREPLTEELLNELLSSPDPNSFLLSANPSRRSLAEYLQQLLDEKGLERSKVVREAGLNDTFGYQILRERGRLLEAKCCSWLLPCN